MLGNSAGRCEHAMYTYTYIDYRCIRIHRNEIYWYTGTQRVELSSYALICCSVFFHIRLQALFWVSWGLSCLLSGKLRSTQPAKRSGNQRSWHSRQHGIPYWPTLKLQGPQDYMNIRILQTIVCGLTLVFGLRNRMCHPHVYMSSGQCY